MTPFLIDRHQIEHPCTVAGTCDSARGAIQHVQFSPIAGGKAVAVGTNEHYLVAVLPPHDVPDWKDFPVSPYGSQNDAEEAWTAPFVLDRDDLKSALRMLGKGSKKFPILNYILVYPPKPGDALCTLAVPMNGEPQIVEVRCRVEQNHFYPSWEKIISAPKEWRHGSAPRTALSAGYVEQIVGMISAVSGRRNSATEIIFAFSEKAEEGPVMIYGTSNRIVALLMPVRSDLDKGKRNQTAAGWAKALRARFVIKEEAPEAEEGEPEGTPVNIVQPVVPIPEGGEVASLGR